MEAASHGYSVTGLSRKFDANLSGSVNQVEFDLFSLVDDVKRESLVRQQESTLERVLSSVDVLIHTAALTPFSDAKEPEYDQFNVAATIELANIAADSGVKRFIFFSSIGVHGDVSKKPIVETDRLEPHNAYSLSKQKAELALTELSQRLGMELITIRAPMVYGQGAKGSFSLLKGLVLKGVPLPFAGIKNKRSFIAIDNLIDFTMVCTKHPKAANEVFLVSDNEDVSTKEFIRRLGKAYNRSVLMFPFPAFVLSILFKVIGKDSIRNSLLADLQLDSQKAQKLLSWVPKITMEEQMNQIVEQEIKEELGA